jgi:hypothetical protein
MPFQRRHLLRILSFGFGSSFVLSRNQLGIPAQTVIEPMISAPPAGAVVTHGIAGGTETEKVTGTPASAAALDESARTFMHTVAHDVTQEGPLAWLNFFNTGPEFFMAVNGQLAFPNAAAAKEGTQNFARTINRIDLTWGDDLRVDPLTAELAVVAATWREIQVDKAGHRIEEAGYFTGLAERRDGRWRFRDAHWSAPISPPPPR